MREGKDADSTLSNLPLRSAETGNTVPKKYYFFNPFYTPTYAFEIAGGILNQQATFSYQLEKYSI